MKQLPILLLLFSLAIACSPKVAPPENAEEEVSPYAFDFVESEQLMPLLEQAKVENKLVFVDLYTTWCLPCRMMEEEVFTDRRLAAYINDHFLSARFDAEKGNGVNLAAIFEAKGFPTLLFLDGNGRVLVRKEGAAFQTELRNMAQEALRQGGL